MTRKLFSLASAAAVVALMGGAAIAPHTAYSQDNSATPPSATAKPSPYQGVSQPPPDDTIKTTDDQQSQPSPAAPAAVPAPAPTAPAANSGASTVAIAPPAPEDPDDEDDADVSPATPQLTAKNTVTSGSPEAGAGGEIVTYIPGPANALPEGTIFRVRMLQNILASDTVPGSEFRAELTQNLMHDGRIVVPIGSELRGKVVRVSYGRRITGSSSIHLRPDEFILPDGTRYHLHASVIDTQGSDTKATGEGDITVKAHGKRAIAEMAIGTGGGAMIGSLGGPTGVAVGSVVGASVMGAHLLLANQSVDLPEQSTVIFSLNDPMFLTPSHD